MKLSIIVPVYNSEKYLERCLHSIRNQTFFDMEVIVIDDGSVDKSGEIADQFMKEDARFHVIHQKNQGEPYTRNKGMEIAQGEWIGFVDSDDWCEPEMYEKLLQFAENYKLDMAYCGWTEVSETGAPTRVNKFKEKIFENATEFLNETWSYEQFVVWNKIFRKEKWKIPFNEHYPTGQDKIFIAENLMFNNLWIGRMTDILYIYQYNPNGLSKSNVKWGMVFSTYIHLISLMERLGWRSTWIGQKRLEWIYFDFTRRRIQENKLEQVKEINQLFRKYLRKHAFSMIINPEIGWKERLMCVLWGFFGNNEQIAHNLICLRR